MGTKVRGKWVAEEEETAHTHSTGGVWIVKVGKRSRGLGGAHDDGPWGRRGHTEVLEVACLLMEVIRRQESRRK